MRTLKNAKRIFTHPVAQPQSTITISLIYVFGKGSKKKYMEFSLSCLLKLWNTFLKSLYIWVAKSVLMRRKFFFLDNAMGRGQSVADWYYCLRLGFVIKCPCKCAVVSFKGRLKKGGSFPYPGLWSMKRNKWTEFVPNRNETGPELDNILKVNECEY